MLIITHHCQRQLLEVHVNWNEVKLTRTYDTFNLGFNLYTCICMYKYVAIKNL